MRKKISNMLAVMLLLQTSAFSQLEKGTWLVGGSASFEQFRKSYTSIPISFKSNGFELSVSPSIGNFLWEKFATGVRPVFTQETETTESGISSNWYRFSAGPFVRYYLLQTEKPFNFFLDSDMLFGINRRGDRGNIERGEFNRFSVSTGVEVFFNSSLGLQFLFGYYRASRTISDAELNGNFDELKQGISSQIGLQFHLSNN